ncbi:beta-galactosidase [Lachnospiraceae bacterium KM106-2]|nr:beta-galactosidase [Lachnospiraceae bacterium KM106-2]
MMKKLTNKRLLTLLMIFLLLCSLNQVTAKAERTLSSKGVKTNNYGSNNYATWSAPIFSHLYQNADGTYTRIENHSPKLIRETYDSKFRLISKKKINRELEDFGGFYAGKDANYLVFGASNAKQSNSKEVYRIVKYSKNWVRLGSCSLRGANTKDPFYAGSLRFAEANNKLYIRTCHEMYKSKDGYCHQASVMIEVDTEKMKITDSHTSVSWIGAGYVSHSFNQFIKVDGTDLLAVDHGDAYPRGIALIKYDQKAGEETFTDDGCESKVVLKFKGEIGQNSTGASVGGFEASASSYLIAGNNTKNGTRNIFISVTPKADFQKQASQTIYLTNYTSKKSQDPSTPHLVKISENRFMLLWREGDEEESYVRYVLLDGTGKKLTKIHSMRGELSDCTPIVSGNKIVWYYTKEGSPIFCTIPVNGSKTKDNMILGDQIVIKGFTYVIEKNRKKAHEVGVKSIDTGKRTTLTVPDKIKYKGITYQVTTMKANAFSNYNDKLKTVVLGKNIKTLEHDFLPAWNQLKTLKIKSTKISKVEKNAFSYQYGLKIKVPKSKVKDYKKRFNGKGQGSITITN